MSERSSPLCSSVIPGFRYRDAAAAIAWLCDAFGFEKNAVYSDESGMIAHAQLTYGGGMIMLGSVRDDELGRQMIHPNEAGARATVCTYVVVDDPNAHYAHAKAHGARIVREIRDEEYGGRDYTCLDCEGHLWCFGNYDPWAAPSSL